MRKGIEIEVNAADRARLEAIVADRNSPQKHVWRARIILATADGCGTAAVMRRAGVSKPSVWRWQERFMTEGVAGLLHDKTRPARIPPLPKAVVEAVVTRTLDEAPPDAVTHWTAPAMAAASGLSVSSVQRIWRAHGLRSHQVRRFKLSTDPRFAEKGPGALAAAQAASTSIARACDRPILLIRPCWAKPSPDCRTRGLRPK